MGCAWGCVCGIGRIIRCGEWATDFRIAVIRGDSERCELIKVPSPSPRPSRFGRGGSCIALLKNSPAENSIQLLDLRDMPLLRSLGLLFSVLQIFRSYGA